ncbi:MAG: DNA recombination protein RmuC [Firmicutes bacterium]|nr:DNA recombination protein RmuC [Bacillota bacterium]
MSVQILWPAVLSVVSLITLWAVLTARSRQEAPGAADILRQIASLESSLQRLETAMRDEATRGRLESTEGARQLREELSGAFKGLGDGLVASLEGQSRRTMAAVADMSAQHKSLLDAFLKQMHELTQMNEKKLESLRTTVEARLAALQEDNGRKLEQMRATVDEKLHESLEKRLGESFKQVSDRLEQVHKGLGEMHTLAAGVGDLKKVLTNVKTRGTLGEVQLDTLLEQVLSPEQYQRSVQVKQGSAERVDFAIALPGQEGAGDHLWLPIDAKFPLEDYQRLVDAQEAGDVVAATEAGRLLEGRVRGEARSIFEKYVNPPATTDFAILFLPLEGLFAELLRRPGLWEGLQREYRVILTGPTTITALLNSLQMGFRTLAIQKRSSDVWQLLGAVKADFGKFADMLDKTHKKLQEASNTIDTASRQSRTIQRRLREVEVVSVAGTGTHLMDEAGSADIAE